MTTPTPAATDTDLGPSWLASAPDRAVVTRRRITAYTVAEVDAGHIGGRPEGKRRCEWFDLRLIAAEEAPLVVVGARFWLVEETYRGRPGTGCVGIALRRPGVATAEQAFTDRRGGAK